MFCFRMYVKGENARSQKALKGFKTFLELYLKNNYSFEIFDILSDFEMAESDRILATPIVIKLDPPPKIRIIGDMSNPEKLFEVFRLNIDKPEDQ